MKQGKQRRRTRATLTPEDVQNAVPFLLSPCAVKPSETPLTRQPPMGSLTGFHLARPSPIKCPIQSKFP